LALTKAGPNLKEPATAGTGPGSCAIRFEERGAHARPARRTASRARNPLSCWALFVKKGMPMMVASNSRQGEPQSHDQDARTTPQRIS
jgi:hypothetical protein